VKLLVYQNCRRRADRRHSEVDRAVHVSAFGRSSSNVTGLVNQSAVFDLRWAAVSPSQRIVIALGRRRIRVPCRTFGTWRHHVSPSPPFSRC